MKIEKTKYVIVTKEFPLLFDDGDNYLVDVIEDAYLWDSYEDANDAMKVFDKPEEYQILKVNVTYKF